MMWPFTRRSARREDIRRSRAEREVTLIQHLRDRYETWPVVLTLVVACLSAGTINLGGPVMDVRVGQTLAHPLAARVNMRLLDEQQTRALQLRARDSSPNCYELNTALIEDFRGRITSLLTLARTHSGDASRLRESAAASGLVIDEAGAVALLRLGEASDAAEFSRWVDAGARVLAAQPLVEFDETAQRRTPIEALLLEPENQTDRSVPVTRLMFNNTREHAAGIAESVAQVFAPELRATIRASTIALLTTDTPGRPLRPCYRFLSERTAQRAEEAVQRVPAQYLTYARGALLADAGPVTADERELLRAEHALNRAQTRSDRDLWRTAWLSSIGKAALVFVIGAGLAFYIARYQPRAIRLPVRQTTTAIVVFAALVAGRGVFVFTSEPYLAVGAQAFAATLLGLVFARGLVFAISGALAAVLTLATQQGVAYLIVLVAVSGALVLQLQDVRSRGRIVAVGFVSAIVAMLVTLAAGLIDQQTLTFATTQGLMAAAVTVAAAFVVEGLLPWIERIFSFSTSMTLLEWCDASRPLLRLMAAEAPGTYNHSLLVGALAENAAEAIGANGLQARTGAYYHDIGKIRKPEYFIENQSPQFSRHERLSPAMSLLIIIGHVKDGIEMAKEYRLPPVLRPFIAEHHGTTVVEYFYAAANKARKPDEPPISDTEFRYPGPKPQSRETAIVMLCDGVEGAVRAMSEPTPGRIEDTVRKVLRKRLMDGQLDECDLTFRDLNLIQKSLVKSLCAIYHGRIAYPGDREELPQRGEPRVDVST